MSSARAPASRWSKAMVAPASAASTAAWSAIWRMMPPGDVEREGEPLEIEPLGADRRRNRLLPDPQPIGGRGPREGDVEAQPSRESGIDILGMIGGQDRETRELLHALEQIGDLDVGVAVVRIADGASLAEQCVGLVEEKHGAGALGLVEDDVEVLLGLADVFRDDLREVDGKEIGCELGGDGMGGHRLAGTALPGEQRGDALRVDERAEAPIVEHLAAEADMLDQRAQLGLWLLRKDDAVEARERPIVGAGIRLQPPGEARQPRGRHAPEAGQPILGLGPRRATALGRRG